MLAKRPPMGWNSWNTFGNKISESLIMETADAIVDRGLRDAGYEYVVIDDCWSLYERDAEGRMVADPEKFPHGMKYLADYVHSKGLKFGMYSCAGTLTCAGYPGSFDREYIDAETFASWGVDYLKYDYCNIPYNHREHAPALYRRMGMALKATGREILFSACNWGAEDVWKWARGAGAHIYRSTGDIFDNARSFHDIAQSQLGKLESSAPGCFNDLDMLICGMYGNGNVGSANGCSAEEYKTHFALWCFMNSPLMIGCDVRNCDEETLALLKNAALIAIDQDEEARPPYSVCEWETSEVFCYFKHLSENRYAYMQANFRDTVQNSTVSLYDIGITVNSGYGLELTEVFTGEKIRSVDGHFRVTCEPNSCKVFNAELVKI